MSVWVVYYRPRANSSASVISIEASLGAAQKTIADTQAHEEEMGWDHYPISYIEVKTNVNHAVVGPDGPLWLQ